MLTEAPSLPVTHLDAPVRLNAHAVTAQTIAILPVAATEAHGPHLPITTDCDIAQGHLKAFEAYLDPGVDAVVFPIERVGASDEHKHFSQTQSLPVTVLIDRWLDVARKFAAQGGRRLVIVSSHGGNSAAVDTVILRARAELGMLAVGTAWLRFGFPESLYPDTEKKYGIHGGAIETSLMLHYWPQRVIDAEITDFPSRLGGLENGMRFLTAYGPHRFGWLSSDLNPLGVVGDARLASAEKGAAHADHILKGFAQLLTDVSGFDLNWLAQGDEQI